VTAAPEQDELSPSGLAYLFASQFGVPAKRGTISFATGVTVDTEALAVNLLVLALWSLQDLGYLSLRPYEERRLRVVTSRGVRAVVLRTAELSGIEGRVLRALATDKQATGAGADVYRAVRAIVSESRDPFTAAVALPVDDIVAAGYLTRAPRPKGLGARLTGRPKWTLKPVPERYPELTARIDALAQAWRTYLADPAYPVVSETVRRAIESREADDGSDLDAGGSD
jgi:hypothetical protein